MKTYIVDVLQSKISFSVKLLNTIVKGTFDSYSASLQCDSLQQLNNAEITIEIDAASLNTHEPIRDQHLKSKDFFDTDFFPKILFTNVIIASNGDNTYSLTGDLTIKHLTHRVTFHVVEQQSDAPTYMCTATVTRQQFELTYNPIFEKINQLGDDVFIEVLFVISAA